MKVKQLELFLKFKYLNYQCVEKWEWINYYKIYSKIIVGL